MSHTTWGGIRLTLGRGGMRFTKKASRFNNCIGDKLRGGRPGSRQAAKQAFTTAVGGCK